MQDDTSTSKYLSERTDPSDCPVLCVANAHDRSHRGGSNPFVGVELIRSVGQGKPRIAGRTYQVETDGSYELSAWRPKADERFFIRAWTVDATSVQSRGFSLSPGTNLPVDPLHLTRQNEGNGEKDEERAVDGRIEGTDLHA